MCGCLQGCGQRGKHTVVELTFISESEHAPLEVFLGNEKLPSCMSWLLGHMPGVVMVLTCAFHFFLVSLLAVQSQCLKDR